MIRIFTAFPIQHEFAESFVRLSQKNSLVRKFRWTPEENLHITLFFIGEVEEHHQEKIVIALKSLFREQESFRLEFESVELRGRKHPSMLWAKFRMSETFSLLSEKVYRSVRDVMTIDVVHKDPIPHCTLARIKPHADFTLLEKEMDPARLELNIDSAELWQTEQTKEGVRYKRLEKFMFRD